MHILMSKGSSGDDVERLRRALANALGGDAELFPSLKKSNTPIDEDFDAAIRRWQAGVGLIGDGVVGPRCQLLLDLIALDANRFELALNVGSASRLFPATKPANIARYLPYIEAALGVAELASRWRRTRRAGPCCKPRRMAASTTTSTSSRAPSSASRAPSSRCRWTICGASERLLLGSEAKGKAPLRP